MSDPVKSLSSARARLRLVSIDDHDFSSGATVGETLKAARLRAGMSLEEAALATRVKLHYLQALEDMNTRELPERAYAVGFLKAYAGVLGLDASLLAARYKAETEAPMDVQSDEFEVMRKSFRFPRGAKIALALIAVAVVFAGWRGFKTPDAPEAAPQPADWAPDVYAPPPTAPFVLSAPTIAPDQPVTAPGSTQGEKLVFRATASVTLTIKDSRGKTLTSRTLKAGDLYAVPQKKGLVATVSKPDVVEAIVDGQPMGKLSAATVQLDGLR